MEVSRYLTLFAAPVVALSLVACDDDGGTGIEGDELTQAETEAMTEVLMNQALGFSLGFGFGVGANEQPGITVAAEVVDETFGPLTDECPFGGAVTFSGAVQGEVDDETSEGNLDFDVEAVHDACGVSDDQEENVFTFTGDDRIASTMGFVFTETSIELDGGTDGGVLWALEDGRSGRCALDVSYDFDITENRIVGSVSGTVCGQDVSEEVDDPFIA